MNFNVSAGEILTYDDIKSDKKNKARHPLQTAYFLIMFLELRREFFE